MVRYELEELKACETCDEVLTQAANKKFCDICGADLKSIKKLITR